MKVEFESERINYIKPKVSFAKFYAENINNPEIYRWLRSDPQRYTIQQEREWIKSIQNERVYTMIDKETNNIIGNIAFNSIKDNVGEMGIWITPSYQNNHYGREAIESINDYGFNVLNLEAITLTVFENNVRAVKCYENVGFKKVSVDYNVKDGIGTPTNNFHMKIEKEK